MLYLHVVYIYTVWYVFVFHTAYTYGDNQWECNSFSGATIHETYTDFLWKQYVHLSQKEWKEIYYFKRDVFMYLLYNLKIYVFMYFFIDVLVCCELVALFCTHFNNEWYWVKMILWLLLDVAPNHLALLYHSIFVDDVHSSFKFSKP